MINNIVIDKLTLCYTISNPDILLDIMSLKEKDKPKELDFEGDFKLYIAKKSGFKSAYDITYFDTAYNDNTNELKQFLFGTLKFGQLDDEDDSEEVEFTKKKVWIDINNSTFYFRFNFESTKLIYLNFITNRLGLKLNNVTHIDISVDSDEINFAKSIKSLLRCKQLVPIIINNAYEDRDKLIPHVKFIYPTSCNRLTNNYSLYIEQKGSENVVLNCYNKLNEITESSDKNYISEYYNYPVKLNRIEIRLHRRQFQQYINENNIEFLDDLFLDNDFLVGLFMHYLYKIIRFRKGKSGKIALSYFEALEWLNKTNKEIRTKKRVSKFSK